MLQGHVAGKNFMRCSHEGACCGDRFLILVWRASIGNEKVGACFYPQNIRRAARKFLSIQGASPEQWVNTSVRFILEIYLTLRSATRKVTACFYPQNIRCTARKFLSVQGRRPNSGRTLPYVLYSEIYLMPNNSIDVITIATIFQIIRIGGRSVVTNIFITDPALRWALSVINHINRPRTTGEAVHH